MTTNLYFMKDILNDSDEDFREKVVHNLLELRTSVADSQYVEGQLKVEQDRYQQAKLDGDASENSALQEARKNIAVLQQQLIDKERAAVSFNTIMEPEYLTKVHVNEFVNLYKDVMELDPETDLFGAAYRHMFGTKSLVDVTRKEYMDFIKLLEQLMRQEEQSEKFNYLYNQFRELEIYKPRPYVSTGDIVTYSCVTLDINGQIYRFMICPKGISYPEYAIVEEDCDVVKQIRAITNKQSILFNKGNSIRIVKVV